MKIEVVKVLLDLTRKLVHITETDIKETKLSKNQDEGLKDALAYVNKYCSDNGFKPINIDKEAAAIYFFIGKD